jgi:N-acetylglucosamine-6-phosphate deacetylase
MIGDSVEQPQGRFALVNGRIVLPQEIVAGKALVMERGKILGAGEPDSLGSGVQRIDVGGRLIAPGLVDIHTHGALGHTFNEPTTEAFAIITAENVRRGVTSLLATLAAAPLPDLCRCLEFCRRWMEEAHDGAQIAGAHLESPYISMAQRGALDPQNVRVPDDAASLTDDAASLNGTPELLLEHHDVLRIFVLAPELPGALGLVAKLARLGIVPAAGHSSAKDEHVLAAMSVGLRHVTHIWSGMSSTIREGPWRKPGLLEAALVFDGLTVEMIADNKHLPPTLMKLAYKCIGADRLCVISDATSGAGLPEGARFRMGAMEYEVHDGVGMMFDRSCFAGSTTLVNQMVPILTDAVGIPLVEAVRMASLTPARVIGMDDRKGSLEAGKDADIAIFNHDFTCWRTMIGGRWVYTAVGQVANLSYEES